MDKKLEESKRISIQLIKNDINTISQIVNHIKEKEYMSVFSLGFIPYLSLCVYESTEYISQLLGAPLFTGDVYKILEQTRQKTKIFSDRYSKTMNTLESIDKSQDAFYKNNRTVGSWLQGGKYYNLGLYYMPSDILIFNTYLAAFYFRSYFFNGNEVQDEYTFYSKHSMRSFEEQSQNILGVSIEIGRLAGIIDKAIDASCMDTVLDDNQFVINSFDANINKDFNHMFSRELTKKDFIFCMWLQCVINYVIYFYDKIVLCDSGLNIKIKYLIYDYTIKSIEQYIRKANHEGTKGTAIYRNFNYILCNKKIEQNTIFGNHMRHYGVENIDSKALDISKPLCGLVEHCYSIPYADFSSQINTELKNISSCLSKIFPINTNSLRSPK